MGAEARLLLNMLVRWISNALARRFAHLHWYKKREVVALGGSSGWQLGNMSVSSFDMTWIVTYLTTTPSNLLVVMVDDVASSGPTERLVDWLNK